MGRWLLIETYPTVNQKGECNDALYSLNSDNSTVDVYNTEVLDQELLTINGTAVLAYNDGSAKLNVSFPTSKSPKIYLNLKYIFIITFIKVFFSFFSNCTISVLGPGHGLYFFRIGLYLS